MTLNEYQQSAAEFMNKDIGSAEQLLHALFGMASEVGELHGIYQKFYQGHPIDEEHCMKELGDILWMISEYATVMGISLNDVAHMNIAKLTARYPDGFRVADSLNRKEGDI